MYLPDTNVFIYAFGGVKPWSEWLGKVIAENKLIVSAIVIAEFLEGADNKDRGLFLELLDRFEVLSVDRMVAEEAAKFRKKFASRTSKVWLSDCLIASTCKVHGVTLVTVNRKNFPMEDVEILSDFAR